MEALTRQTVDEPRMYVYSLQADTTAPHELRKGKLGFSIDSIYRSIK